MTRNLLLAGVSMALSACVSAPDDAAPDVSELTPAAFKETGTAQSAADWWRGFGDETLAALVDDALSSNRDLKSAEASVRIAGAALAASRFDKLPTIRSDAQYRRGRTSSEALGATIPGLGGGAPFPDANLFDAGLSASWELDFWGRVRSSISAARARYEGADADYDSALVLVTADVANAYFSLRGNQRLLDVARRNAEKQRETQDLIISLQEAGRATILDAARARAQYEATLATLPPLEAAVDAQARRLAVLTGRAPDALADMLAATRSFPAYAAGAPAGDPGEIIRMRPDIRSAEHALAAAIADIGVARSDLFPRVRFVGAVGASAATLSGFGKESSLDYGFGPTIEWAAFDLGRVRARIRQSEAAADGALARYEQTVLLALEETANAFTGLARERERAARLARVVADSGEAAKLAQTRYTAGIDDFIAVLDAERSLLAAESDLARSETAVLRSYVGVYRALGGGWQAARQDSTAPASQ